MKFRIPTAIIGSGLQVVAALNTAVSGRENSTAILNPPLLDPVDSSRVDPDRILTIGTDDDAEVTPRARMAVQTQWNRSAQTFFSRLVVKESLGSASEEEMKELESLTNLRRQSEMARSGEEVLRDYEQGQLIRNLLHSLTRYVEFEQRFTPGASAARSRSTEKA
jgi:hypothetical protein